MPDIARAPSDRSAGRPRRSPRSAPQPEPKAPAKTKEFVIINWSGELDKIWPTLILSSTAAASGMQGQGLHHVLGPAPAS